MIIMAKVQTVLVVAEDEARARELLSGAQQLGEQIVFYCHQGAPINAGGVRLTASADKEFTELIASLAAFVEGEKPDVVLLSGSQNCRLLAGILAAKRGTSALCDVQTLSIEDDQLEGERMVYGGAANRVERAALPGAVALVAAAAFPPVEDGATPEERALPLVDSPICVVGTEEKAVESVDLASAKTLVCVGRGFGAEEELKLAEDFARCVGGEIGCTRPISEGEGWMSSARYVGVSGLMLKPDVYFGLGISGQIQHMVGVSGARVVVAVNKDPKAPIFDQCDIGLVASVQEALPLLVDSL